FGRLVVILVLLALVHGAKVISDIKKWIAGFVRRVMRANPPLQCHNPRTDRHSAPVGVVFEIGEIRGVWKPRRNELPRKPHRGRGEHAVGPDDLSAIAGRAISFGLARKTFVGDQTTT